MSKGLSKNYYMKTSQLFGWGDKGQLDQERLKLLEQYIYGKKILDIGCGFGHYVDFLSNLGFDSYGLDFVEQFIEKAKLTKKGVFLKGNGQNLPFRSNFFDTIYLFNILEHGNDIKILQEAKRVSKKRILVIVPRKVDADLEMAGVVFRHYIDKTHLREYDQEDLRKLSSKVGLKLINMNGVHKLNNKLIFIALFKGPKLFRDIVRKIVFWILPRESFPTEYFVVFEK